MKLSVRHLLTLALLATYGSAALLGYGLHMFAPHAHHHGLDGVVCSAHSGHSHAHQGSCATKKCCTSHCHATTPAAEDATEPPAGLTIAATDCDTGTHECDICVFLVQARGMAVEVVADVVWQHVLAPAHLVPSHPYLAAVLGPQAPRGPPISFA